MEEQWQTPWARGAHDRALWGTVLMHTRALKRALARLAIDVLTEAPGSSRRASSRCTISSGAALLAAVQDLPAQQLTLVPQLQLELTTLIEAAAVAGTTAAPSAATLEALRLSYRSLRVSLSPYLPTEMVAEGVPMSTRATP